MADRDGAQRHLDLAGLRSAQVDLFDGQGGAEGVADGGSDAGHGDLSCVVRRDPAARPGSVPV